ncbi:MAG: tail fiber domain-containing protein [Agriterribacter sp.]
MKTILSTTILFAVFALSYQHLSAQANTALSNLVSPTAVNQSLTPNTNNNFSLGSGTYNWKYLYMGTAYYLKNLRILHAPGNTNFFAGPSAGNAGTTGTNNTSLGDNTLIFVSSGGFNTAVGFTALRGTTTGSRNTGVGYTALYNNTSGGFNVAIGDRALYVNSTGGMNVVNGATAMFFNTSGSGNTAYGHATLYNNKTGYSNVAVGTSALYSNVTSGNNVAIGDSALLKNTASAVVAVGSKALMNNTTGPYNIAIGYRPLYSNTTGGYNTALGVDALANNTTGNYNIAMGYQAMHDNTGNYNTASGGYAANKNTTGNYNTSNGFAALYLNTTGNYNTASGDYALYSNVSGNGNTALGYFTDVYFGTLTNATVIGYNATIQSSNQVMLGNSSVTSVKAASSVVIYSDGRYKKQVKENVPGLDFIKQLRPVTYHYDIKGMNEHAGVKGIRDKIAATPGNERADVSQMEQLENASIEAKEKILYTGFIAQDVEAAAQKMNYDFNGVYKPQNEKDLYGLSYESFVAPVVKSIQELSIENDSLKNEISILKQSLAEIQQILKIKPSDLTLSGASVAQNSPNPFKTNTAISYSIPQTVSSAQLVIYDAAGKPLKQFNIAAPGRGTLNIDAATLPSGTYHYSLFADGKMIDTKKMVLVK